MSGRGEKEKSSKYVVMISVLPEMIMRKYF